MDSNAYLRDSARTVSTQYHQELVTANEIDFALQAVTAAAAWVDRVKRGLFYGKAFTLRTSTGSTTSAAHKPELADLLHAVLGCVTESAEMAEHLLDVLRGAKAMDKVNLVEEIGDIEWYVALALRFVGSDHDDAWTRNIAKLRARFPDKFTEEAAVTRDLVAERAVLENAVVPVDLDICNVCDQADYCRGQATCHYRGSPLCNPDGTPRRWVPDAPSPVDQPEPNSTWQHYNGAVYTVLHVDTDRYPATVVYQTANGGKIWARRLDDWHRSMTEIEGAPPPAVLGTWVWAHADGSPVDPTAQTGPLTKGQQIVEVFDADLIAEPCELAETIDRAIWEAVRRDPQS